MNQPSYAIAVCAASLLPLSAVRLSASTATEVESLTGSRTKLVWCHARGTGQGEPVEENQEIRVLDTREGTERVLLPATAIHFNPYITPSGNEVVYNEGLLIGGNNGNSTLNMGKTRVVKWDGTGIRDIGPGIPVWVWRDPQTNREWVYVSSPKTNLSRYSNDGPIIRYRLDDPSISQVAYQPGLEYTYYIGMSADGKYFGGQMTPVNIEESHGIRVKQDPAIPAPAGTFPNPVFESYQTGFCSSNFSRDNSYRYFHYDHCHCALIMYDANMRQVTYNDTQWESGANSHYVWVQPYVNTARPFPDDNKTWSLKWSSDVRFVTVTGQSTYGRDSGNIYLGKFNPAFTGFERWVRVTDRVGFETHSYAWIESGGTSVRTTSGVLTPKEGDVFAVGDTVVITWQMAEGQSIDAAVELSYDTGMTWHQISGHAILGTLPPVYRWVAEERLYVPGRGQMPLTGRPLSVRIREYSSDRVAGESGMFSIVPSAGLIRGRRGNGRFPAGGRDARVYDARGKLLSRTADLGARARSRVFLITYRVDGAQRSGMGVAPHSHR